ncbi:hypothetical protein [Halomicrococcus gelatinilyticus]|uniref:hypothetical protein n=1 Tax=Halomicrococcus gelatinilyticus TaxID=1702103 RepID=UPI002E14C554
MSPEAVKRALARLARDAPQRARPVIEEAAKSTGDVTDAADFVDRVGVDRLETAVAAAERRDPGLARRGERALTAFRRFREAATSSRRE